VLKKAEVRPIAVRIGPDAELAKPEYCMKLLLTLDQLFFYI
jgi:hypothetical protein